MDTNSFIDYIKTEGIYLDIPKDVETRSDTSNYKLDRPLSKGKNKKVIRLIKDKLGREIMKEFAEIYSYITDNNGEDK